VAVVGRRLASVAEITILRAGVERLDELVGFWKLLHRHQSSVATAVPGLDVLSESDSAVIVGTMYREWLSGPDSPHCDGVIRPHPGRFDVGVTKIIGPTCDTPGVV
jgi:hypothetical protein